MRGTRAVTLAELLIVMVIVALGAAAAVPLLGKGLENQKMTAVQSSVRFLRDRIMLYARDRGGAMPVLTTDGEHDLKRLFDAQYLVPSDLAFYRDLGTGVVANYSVYSYLNDIEPLPAGTTRLYKVCGKFDAASSRFFCIYQCLNGARESTETVDASIRDTCP